MSRDADLWALAVSLGIGLLLGLERERRKGRGPGRGAAGIRTFALVALLGGVSLRVGGSGGLVVGAAFVAAAAIVSYIRGMRADDDPGLTTEVALVVTYMLGALAQRDAGLAAALAVGVAVLLASRTWLHRLVRDTLTDDEVHDGLLFAAAALVILPLLPDRDLGPHGALNPATVWRLVIIITAIGAIGHVAVRTVGPRFGLPLAGLASGFISSIMTIVAMGRRAAQQPPLIAAAVAGAVMSSVATVALTAVVVGAVSPGALREMWLPLAFAGVATLAAAAFATGRSARTAPPETISPGRAFDLRAATVFAGALTGSVVLASVFTDALGGGGLVVVAAAAGLADAQAASAAAAALVASGAIEPHEAVLPVVVGLSTNTATKAVAALLAGRVGFARGVWPGLVLLMAGAWGGVVLAAAS